MNLSLSRRQFLTRSAALGALALAPGLSLHAAEFRGRLRRAMIVGEVKEDALRPLKEAGFEGVETTHICPETEAAQGRAVAEKMGMKVHSVLRGWMEFNSTDDKKVEESLEKTRLALRAAKAYGADAILLVPCRIGGMPMPEAWEFDVEFDPQNGHLKRVAAGDNTKYAAYIEAHDRATDTSRSAVEKLIPLAEELKIVIGLENVWNNLWVKPDLFAHFVSSFKNRWVKAYFDIGNHVKYAPPQDFIRKLGPLVAKVHIKDFKLNPDGHGGKFVHPRDGSIDWPVVRRALDEAGYDGWATIEDGGLPLAEFNQRLELIDAGK
ncbi:MAG TPA: sugar phosphate isomerase/epimerase family protein [Verrucomicrobiae bacterium]